MTTHFEKVLLAKIEKKIKYQIGSLEFQDLHWDDTYSVYYDSSK